MKTTPHFFRNSHPFFRNFFNLFPFLSGKRYLQCFQKPQKLASHFSTNFGLLETSENCTPFFRNSHPFFRNFFNLFPFFSQKQSIQSSKKPQNWLLHIFLLIMVEKCVEANFVVFENIGSTVFQIKMGKVLEKRVGISKNGVRFSEVLSKPILIEKWVDYKYVVFWKIGCIVSEIKVRKFGKNSGKKVGKFKKISCGISRCNNTFIQPVMASLSKLTEKDPWRLQLCITIKGFTLWRVAQDSSC